MNQHTVGPSLVAAHRAVVHSCVVLSVQCERTAVVSFVTAVTAFTWQSYSWPRFFHDGQVMTVREAATRCVCYSQACSRNLLSRPDSDANACNRFLVHYGTNTQTVVAIYSYTENWATCLRLSPCGPVLVPTSTAWRSQEQPLKEPIGTSYTWSHLMSQGIDVWLAGEI